MTRQDIGRGLELCRLANFNQVRADWDYFLTHASVFVAEVEERVVGTCAVLDRHGPVAWIAMMLVDPSVRRQSIGMRLFEHTLAHTKAPSVGLDATAMGRPLYEKYGFIASAAILRMKRDALSVPGHRSVPTSWRAGHASNQIGPVMADCPDEAAAQVLSALAKAPNRAWIIDVPQAPPQAWHEWLQLQGFVPQRPLIRMFRGPAQSISANFYATSGPEYGFHSRTDT